MAPLQAFWDEMLPHRQSLTRAARRLNPVDAEDLVQETYLRALLGADRFTPGSSAAAWLGRIMRHRAIDLARRSGCHDRGLRRLAGDPTLRPSAPSTPDELWESAAIAKNAQDARYVLSGLRSSEKEIIELCDLGGFSYRDAAAKLGCPVGTVMSRLHRARRRLSSAWAVAQPAGASPRARTASLRARGGFRARRARP